MVRQKFGCGICGNERPSKEVAMKCCFASKSLVFDAVNDAEDRAINVANAYTDKEVGSAKREAKAEMMAGTAMLFGFGGLVFAAITGDAFAMESLGRAAVMFAAICVGVFGVWLWMR